MFVLATVEVSSPGKARAVFNKQPCEVNVNTKMLACDSSGTSPLAGTRYVGQLVKRKNADPITRYRCVKGCENNSRAPTTMVQDDQSD